MKKLLMSALVLVALMSCSKNDENPSETNYKELCISVSTDMYPTGNEWESGNTIGVYMTSMEGEDFGEYGSNVPYTATNSNGDFTSSTPIEFPEEVNVGIYVYYPYNSNLESLYYPADVNSQDDHTAIDLMVAKVTDIVNDSTAVEMTFYHRLSFLSFEISGGDALTAEELEGLEVILSGTQSTADVALFGGLIAFPEVDTDITLKTTSSGTLAEAIVIPQILDYLKLTLKTKAGDTYVADLTTKSFSSKTEYYYSVTFKKAADEIYVEASDAVSYTWE